MAEINVTPLVDVMLVLLIVFMVTAPLLVPQNLDISLPKTAAVRSQAQEVATRLTILASGSLLLDEKAVSDTDLANFFSTQQKNPDFRIRVEADQAVPYGRLAEIMGMAQSAGVTRMSFATLASTVGSTSH